MQLLGGAAGLALVTALSVVPGPDSAAGAGPGLVVSAALVLAGGLAALLVRGARPARLGPKKSAL